VPFFIKDLNPSGSEWSAGGTSEPRGGLLRRAGQIPPSAPKRHPLWMAFFFCLKDLSVGESFVII